MPLDDYKMTMEAKPLRLLYSKYAPQAPLGSGAIRPLGSVRRCGSPGSDDQAISLSQLEGEVSKVERVQRYLAMSDGGAGLMDMYGSRKSLHSLVGSESEKGQGANRSRNQSFENKYKLAVNRGPHEQKAQNMYTKRVIQLPLLKINLETYVGETEDNRTLESTRRSLRHIMDANKKTTGSSGTSATAVKQPGLTQYQFKTPGELQKEAVKSSTNYKTQSSERLSGVHFSPKQEGHRLSEEENEPSVLLESVCDESRTMSESSAVMGMEDIYEERGEEGMGGYSEEEFDYVYERDANNSSVMAQRLSSAATLGTSYRYLDFEPFVSEVEADHLKSIYSNRQKTTAEGMRGLQPLSNVPIWPSLDDVRNLCPDFGNANLEIKPQAPQEVRIFQRGTSVIMKKAAPDSFVIRNGVTPKLKYTSHRHPKQKQKLQPMTSVPHTQRECPMCNLFKVKEPTPCPPNTPRYPGEQIPEILSPINPDSLADVSMDSEIPGENDDDKSDRSDIEFRKRHRLLDYDINFSARKLDPIGHREGSGELLTEYRLGNAIPNTSR